MQNHQIWSVLVICMTLLSLVQCNAARDEFENYLENSQNSLTYQRLFQQCRDKGAGLDTNKWFNDFKECQSPIYMKISKSRKDWDEAKEVGTGMTIVDTIKFGHKLTSAQVHLVTDDIKFLCEALPTAFKCSKKDLQNLIGKCTSEFDFESAGKVLNHVESILQAVCKNNGKNIADFITKNGVSCLPSYGKSGEKCGRDTLEKLKGSTSNIDVQDIDGKLCKVSDDAYKCLHNSLDSCQEKEASKALQTILTDFHESLTKTTCGTSKTMFSYILLAFVVLLLEFF